MTDLNRPSRFRSAMRGRNGLALGGAALLALGGVAGAVSIAATRPSVVMAPATPIAIRSLADESIVTVKGRVAETYGSKFILADATGRALIDTGPEGTRTAAVSPGQVVTVQGRFDDGFVHASFLVDPEGKVVALGPVGRPHGGPAGGRHGGPDGGPDGPDGRAPDDRAPETQPSAAATAPTIAPIVATPLPPATTQR